MTKCVFFIILFTCIAMHHKIRCCFNDATCSNAAQLEIICIELYANKAFCPSLTGMGYKALISDMAVRSMH